MMRVVFLLLLSFFCLNAKAQLPWNYPGVGIKMKMMIADSVARIPSDTTSNKSGIARINSTLYVGNGVKWSQVSAGVGGSGWALTGNAGLDGNVNYLGTSDDVDLVLKRNGGEVLRFVTNNGTAFNGSTASGSYSTAMGRGTLASGENSTAMGENTTASGISSTAMGNGTAASNYVSTAMGYLTTASGDYSTAMGRGTLASGEASTAMGEGTIASGIYSTAMGSGTTASGIYSTAMGSVTRASGQSSTAMGASTTSSGSYSTSMGIYTTSKSYAGTVVGSYNDSTNAADAANFNSLNRAFQIGIGTANNARANAMTVLFNGRTGLGTVNPDTTLHVNGGLKLVNGTQGTGKVLTSDANGLSTWADQRAIFTVSTNTSAGSVAGTDYIYIVTNGSTITLPTAVGNKNMYTVKRTGVSNVSVATTASQTIDGAASPFIIAQQYNSVNFISDNSNWIIVSHYK